MRSLEPILPTSTASQWMPMRTIQRLQAPRACQRSFSASMPALDAQRRHAGAPGMILEQRRRAPEGHDAVADELVDRAGLLVDRLGDQLEIGRHAQQQLLRRQLLGQGREGLEIGEEDGEEAAVAAELQLLLRCRSWRDQADRHEGGERLDRGVERVDRLRQHRDLADRRLAAAADAAPPSSCDLADLQGELLERRGDHAVRK